MAKTKTLCVPPFTQSEKAKKHIIPNDGTRYHNESHMFVLLP